MIFTEQDRQIYSDPTSGRKYDPLAVKRALSVETKGQFNDLVVKAGNGDPEAQGKLIAAARKAFALAPLGQDGSGVLDAAAYDTLTDFTRWLKGKGPRAQTRPNSAPCSDSPARSATTPTSP